MAHFLKPGRKAGGRKGANGSGEIFERERERERQRERERERYLYIFFKDVHFDLLISFKGIRKERETFLFSP